MKQGLFTLGLSVALSIMAGCRSQQEGWKLVWEENFDQEDHFDEASNRTLAVIRILPGFKVD